MAIFYPLFLISLFLSTISANVNWSIDCGTSGNSTVDRNSVRWIGDDIVISTGQPKSVSATFLYSSSDPISFVVNTLRAFPTGKKNCYVLGGEIGAKVQLRVMFYYGNYDGKSAPPTFGLQFDGNEWATVETTMDSNTYLYYDVVYVTKGDNINVCLIQTDPSHVPFVSAIQVRTLNFTTYDLADYGNALFLVTRRSLSTQSIRYPTDRYDRIWTPMSLTGSQYTRLTYNGSVINTSTSPEKPPQDVLKNALSTSAGTLKWTIPELPSTPISVYLMFYFSEMTVLTSTQTRAFSVFIGGSLMNSTIGLTPPYGGVTELTVYNILMSSTTAISLVPAVYSTEPPLVNAMEVFQVSDYMVSYTSATATSPSPPDSSSDDTPPPPSSLSGDTPPPPPPPPPPRSLSSGEELGSSYSENKSHSQEIIRGIVPVLVFLTVFVCLVLLRRKRTRVVMTSGTNTREVGYNNMQNQNQMMNNDHAKGVAMNEFTVNVKDSKNGDRDMADRDRAYSSPAPLLHNQHNYHA